MVCLRKNLIGSQDEEYVHRYIHVIMSKTAHSIFHSLLSMLLLQAPKPDGWVGLDDLVTITEGLNTPNFRKYGLGFGLPASLPPFLPPFLPFSLPPFLPFSLSFSRLGPWGMEPSNEAARSQPCTRLFSLNLLFYLTKYFRFCAPS